MNVDGAISGIGYIAATGVVRDSEGAWCFGYARSVASCAAMVTELWVAHDGLTQVWRVSYRTFAIRYPKIARFMLHAATLNLGEKIKHFVGRINLSNIAEQQRNGITSLSTIYPSTCN
ncbi:hypothetical protein V6N12_049579 [Hibiscus sabdariffa]|uniref:RNase H type-1 domain-containing protein n=1 Tax=Hibiscus sabdariffa TaxID=183260 RepID=A0ABR2GAA8_9ROSI